MAYQIEVTGLKDLEKNLKAIAKVIGGNELADSLAKGAMEIVWEAQKNIMAQGLYDEMVLWNSVAPVKVNQYRVDIKVDCDHGAAHEFGLPNQVITDKQRRFFWAMYAKTRDTMWKALALSTTYTIPARPYLRPAIDTQKRAAMQTVAQSLGGKFAHAVK